LGIDRKRLAQHKLDDRLFLAIPEVGGAEEPNEINSDEY